GAPQSRFSTLIRRISTRKSAAICGRPPMECDFQRQLAAKTSTMPAHEGLWPDDRHGLEDRRKPTIQLDEKQAIAVRELDATAHLALQEDQLMPEHGIFCLKSIFRLERRGQ